MAGRYFDHNATSPLDPRAREAMLPWLGASCGNPSSVHAAGRAARAAVEAARAAVAALLDAASTDVVFTASGTEGNATAVAAAAAAAGWQGEIVVSAFEHPSVLAAAERCAARGMTVRRVAPDGAGVVPAAAVLAAVGPSTRLVCLMLANNVVGTLQPVAEVAAACRVRGVPVLCDAVQAVGKVAVSAARLGVDYLTLGGHKFHGPLGAAALWVRPGAPFTPLLVGAGQEGGRRAGTVDVPAVVGLGAACALAAGELAERHAHLLALRERFEHGLAALPAAAVVHGATAPRLPHTSHVAFPGVDGQRLAADLDAAGCAVATGPACGSGRPEPSPALLAMGRPAEEGRGALRVSFGMTNEPADVEALLAALAAALAAARPQVAV